MNNEDKRHHKRFLNNSPINLYRMDFQDQYYYAEMNNYSEGGLSIVTGEKLVINHLIYLEIKNDQNTRGPEMGKCFYGTIKWATSDLSPDNSTKPAYRYGVECTEVTHTGIGYGTEKLCS